MTDQHKEEDRLESVIAEFSERLRKGETPSVEEYVTRYPDLADEIAELLPTIAELECVKSRQERISGGLASLGPLKIEQLGDFTLIREIGRGGMGIVFEARQESLDRRVAIKVLPRHPWQDIKQLEQFKREAQVAAGLHHTNIVQIYGVGEDDGYHYYAMQLIEGVGLDRIVHWLAGGSSDGAEQLGSLCKTLFGSPQEVRARDTAYWRGIARIGQHVAEALAYAHDQGIIHRDIKPGNLLVDQQGGLWVTDFGLAYAAQAAGVTQPGHVAGTLRYLAPEQFQGQVDTRSDIYALGVTLYELLTLNPAYETTDHTRLIRSITQGEPRAPRKIEPRIPRDLETVVLKAMARDPKQRYQSAQDLAEDLRNYRQGRPINARRLSGIEHLWLWSKRNPTVATLSFVAAACLLGAVVVGWRGYYHTQRALQQTRTEYARAEANLNLALQAFEGVFDHMAPSPLDTAPMSSMEEGGYEPMVSPRDVAILQDLLVFYQQFAERNRAASGLQRDMARASYRIGQIYNRLGQFEKAQPACQTAQRFFERSDLEGNRDPLLLIENGLELGWATQMLGQYRQARDIYKSLLARREAMSPTETMLPRNNLLLTQIHLRLGSMPTGQEPDDRRRRRDDPVFHTQTALQLTKALLSRSPRQPTYRYLQALAYRNLALLSYRAAAPEAAEDQTTQALDLLSGLHKQYPQHALYMYDLALTYTLEQSEADFAPGRKKVVDRFWKDRYQEALVLSNDLVTHYPAVPAYLALLSRVHLRLGEFYLGEDNRDQAEVHLGQAHALLGNLIQQELAASSYVCDYLKATQALGHLWQRRGEVQQVRALLEQDLGAIEQMLRSGPRRKREWILLARQYDTLAEVCKTLNDSPAAEDARKRARRIKEEQSAF